MKLVRFGPPGAERPGLWLDRAPETGRPAILDVRAAAFDIRDYDAHFFGARGPDRVRALAGESKRRLIDPETVRLGPPVARPGKIVCLGKNYVDHAIEFGSEPPKTPVYFAKAVSAVIGPHDPVVLPRAEARVDGEVELALVIGRRAHAITADEALSHVAGYLILNDITDRVAQRESQQWFFGKGADTFCPLGPWLVTADAIPDPHNLGLASFMNETALQAGNTSRMIFNIPTILSHLSARVMLEPGDIVSTGTPDGIGSARTPPVLLHAGDTIRCAIDGLGETRNPVIAAS